MERIGPGTLLAGRYRLEEQVQADPVTALWRAEDLTLERPVGVRVLSAEHARVQTTLDAARRAALVDDQRLQRVYGVGVEAGSGYVVLEWVTGQDAGSLAGKVSEAEAVRIVTEAAEALRTAATRQLHHGRLGPRQVVRASDGRVRVVGTGIEVAASGQPTPAAAARPEHRDVRDLSAVLYALATGSWPFGFVEGLLAAPTDKGRPVAARLLRDDLGEPLDRLLGETLAGNGPETLDALVQRLHAVRADLEATAAGAGGRAGAGGAAGAAGAVAGRGARETDDTDVITPVPAAASAAAAAAAAASGPTAAGSPVAATTPGPAAQEPAAAGPGPGQTPSVDPAAAEEPATGEPATGEPATGEPATGGPATGTSSGTEPTGAPAAPASSEAPTRTRRAGVAGAVAAAAGAVAGAAGATAARMTGAGAGTAAGAAGAAGPGTSAGAGAAGTGAAGSGAAGAAAASAGRPAGGTTPPAEVDLTAVEDRDRASVSPTAGPATGGRAQRLLPERDPRSTWGRGYQAAPAAAAGTTPAWQSADDDGWDLLPIGDDDYDETYADGPQAWDEQAPWDSQQPWDSEQWQDDASWEEVSGTGGGTGGRGTGGGGSVLPVTGASGGRRRPAGAGTGVAVVLLMGAFVVAGLVWALDRFRDSDEPVAAPTAVVTETVQPSPEPSAAPEPSEPAPSDDAPQPISPAGVLALDPQGDGEENDADAPSAIDGDPATSWQTQRYNSQDFGGLKTGLGLAFDLGSPRDVTSVTVTAPGAGGTYEVRTAPAPGFDGSTVVATGQTGDAPAELAPETPVNTQFVIIWFTALPDNGGDWRGVVSELQVLVQ